MPGSRYSQLAERAADAFGYVTSADARALGIPVDTLVKLAGRGQLERVSHGVYRVPLFASGPLDQYMEATLWPGNARGVIRGESTLALLGLSDVNPAKIHVAVPPGYRTHREVPDVYVLHREALADDQVTAFEGIPTVTAATAIRQCHRERLRRSLLDQAIDDGLAAGWVRRAEAKQLRAEIAHPAAP